LRRDAIISYSSNFGLDKYLRMLEDAERRKTAIQVAGGTGSPYSDKQRAREDV
jgi:hypothetical protein